MTTPVGQWQPGMDVTAGRLNSMQQAASLLVTNYGADASGTADAAAGIQLALNVARDLGGAQVVVPPGIYLINQTLRIYNNTRLSLMAGAEFRRNYSGTMIINGDAGQDFGGYTGHSRITIEGGLWNMRGTTSGLTGSAMCISIGHATDIVIQDLEIRDTPGFHAIELNSTSHGVIRNCKFRGYVDPGGRDFSEAIQLDLAKSVGVFGGFGPYDHTPCEDVLILGCHFGASGTAGTTAWPRGIGSHSATITKYHRRVRVIGNSFEGLLQYAVSAYNWEDAVINSNTFVSCGSGVRLRSVIVADTEDTKDPNGNQTSASQVMRNLAVVGNTMRSGGGYDNAIIALGEATGTILNLTIVGNSIDGTSGGQAGIRLERVSRCTVADNIVANVAGTGISTENQNNTVLNGNVVWTAGANGITMVTSDNSEILANHIRDPANSGILVQGGSDVQIRSNFVDGANRVASSSYGIRVSTSPTAVAISGNKCRPGSSTTKAVRGLSISSGTGIHRFGNDMRGTWSGSGGTGIDDSSTTPNTTATDIQ
ncbi:plasmin and fibronectin-binding protein A [Streptomyces sp. p1417]|uniref:Plasmin and fibronectin-binding protein A n=1 Tax=Streptomyces typhae TaxID=2681492 RepID=A0A6L6X262_9ACTN|nr:right-handed parallel beta-helix repeat-containing protein [Streptomyces typhae]MVO87938.1 plasmin and fibronectin-binding protein A [Streptomyces typhae]